MKTRLHLLQPRIVFVLEGGLILANFLLQSLATLGAQLRSQVDREHEEAEGKEEAKEADWRMKVKRSERTRRKWRKRR